MRKVGEDLGRAGGRKGKGGNDEIIFKLKCIKTDT